jgi:hypothetical protein
MMATSSPRWTTVEQRRWRQRTATRHLSNALHDVSNNGSVREFERQFALTHGVGVRSEKQYSHSHTRSIYETARGEFPPTKKIAPVLTGALS